MSSLEVDPRRRLDSLLFNDGFLDTLAEGVALVDDSGVIVDCNRVGLEVLGITIDEAVGRTLFNADWNPVFENGSPMPFDKDPLAITLRTGESCNAEIVGVNIGDQARRWLWIDASVLREAGQVKGAVCSFNDVTNRLVKEQMLQLLTEVNRFVMFGADDVDPLQHLCDAIVEHGPYALAWVGFPLLDEERNVDIAYASGLTDYLYEGMVSWSGSKETGLGPVGTALRTGTTQVVEDLTKDSLTAPWRERAGQFGLGSCIAIPFAPGGKRAVLVIYTRHTFATNESRIQGLEDITKEVEFGISHLSATRGLAVALDGTLAALGHMTETRDPYTEGHQIHVGSLGAAIATQLGMDAKMVELVRQSGEVHDVGKIAIPSEILTRPGKLSSLEFQMVKHHAEVGAQVLSKASLPWPIADVALQHHERMDGSGYPKGLRDGDIIMPARIIAVADVVEAMTQHRPYRPGLGLDIALAEVSAGAGKQFDREVVAACLAVFETGFAFGSSPAPDLSGMD